MTIIRDVLKTTGITATVGIGTNLYLAKVAMDIQAKKAAPDKDGVRIAELNEESYCFLLWDHRPLTSFWMVGPGKAKRLERSYLFTMGDIARKSQYDEEWFYKTFRRLGVCADSVHEDSGFYQLNMFVDYEALEREKRLQRAFGEVRSKYGANALFHGKNLLEGATQLERNAQIGGHRA